MYLNHSRGFSIECLHDARARLELNVRAIAHDVARFRAHVHTDPGGNVTPAADVVVENAVEADTEAAEPSTEA